MDVGAKAGDRRGEPWSRPDTDGSGAQIRDHDRPTLYVAATISCRTRRVDHAGRAAVRRGGAGHFAVAANRAGHAIYRAVLTIRTVAAARRPDRDRVARRYRGARGRAC